MIELKNLSKSYGSLTVLQGVNATVNKGDVIAVIGPSGSGKSTLLNCINVLDRATSGHIIFDGEDIMDSKCDIKMIRRKMGMVFQQFNLFNNMTVLENAMYPQLDLLGRSKQEAYDKAMEYLKLVGMSDRAEYYPSELSGGQKQRAAIARTLAMDPEVMLLDEPTSALDPTTVGEVEYVLKKLAGSGRTMIVVTHDLNLAREISNRVFYMDEKGIYEDAPTEQIFSNPKGVKTKQFIERRKCLELTLDKNTQYVDCISEIDSYCDKLGLSKKEQMSLNLLFEEICIITLLPRLDSGTITALFDYDEKTNHLSFTVTHPDEPIMDILDEYSQQIVLNISKDIELIDNNGR